MCAFRLVIRCEQSGVATIVAIQERRPNHWDALQFGVPHGGHADIIPPLPISLVAAAAILFARIVTACLWTPRPAVACQVWRLYRPRTSLQHACRQFHHCRPCVHVFSALSNGLIHSFTPRSNVINSANFPASTPTRLRAEPYQVGQKIARYLGVRHPDLQKLIEITGDIKRLSAYEAGKSVPTEAIDELIGLTCEELEKTIKHEDDQFNFFAECSAWSKVILELSAYASAPHILTIAERIRVVLKSMTAYYMLAIRINPIIDEATTMLMVEECQMVEDLVIALRAQAARAEE
jgi:hypothetical protein